MKWKIEQILNECRHRTLTHLRCERLFFSVFRLLVNFVQIESLFDRSFNGIDSLLAPGYYVNFGCVCVCVTHVFVLFQVPFINSVDAKRKKEQMKRTNTECFS